MFLDDLQKRFADMQNKAGVKAVFGDAIELGGRKVAPECAQAFATARAGRSTTSP